MQMTALHRSVVFDFLWIKYRVEKRSEWSLNMSLILWSPLESSLSSAVYTPWRSLESRPALPPSLVSLDPSSLDIPPLFSQLLKITIAHFTRYCSPPHFGLHLLSYDLLLCRGGGGSVIGLCLILHHPTNPVPSPTPAIVSFELFLVI